MKKIITIIIALCLIQSVSAINIKGDEFVNKMPMYKSINKKLSDFYKITGNAIVLLMEETEHSQDKVEDTLSEIRSIIPSNKCAAVVSYVKASTLRIRLSDNCIHIFSTDDSAIIERLIRAKDDEKPKFYQELLNYVTDSLISSFSEYDTKASDAQGYGTLTKGPDEITGTDVELESIPKEDISEEAKKEKTINHLLFLVTAMIITIILIPVQRKKH